MRRWKQDPLALNASPGYKEGSLGNNTGHWYYLSFAHNGPDMTILHDEMVTREVKIISVGQKAGSVMRGVICRWGHALEKEKICTSEPGAGRNQNMTEESCTDKIVLCACSPQRCKQLTQTASCTVMGQWNPSVSAPPHNFVAFQYFFYGSLWKVIVYCCYFCGEMMTNAPTAHKLEEIAH